MLDQQFWHDKILPFTKKSNGIAAMQMIVTFVPYALLWFAYSQWIEISFWLVIPFSVVTSLFVLRFFVLMHDCGHGAAFKSKSANRIVGFFLGVITGLPQFVWSKNHAYHHSTNGDWVKYGGVFDIITVGDYADLSEKRKKSYWRFRQPFILIPAGVFYVLINPRFNWMAGNLTMLLRIIRSLFKFDLTHTIAITKNWETKYWKSKKDYLHMTYNNLVLISIWFVMCNAIGTFEFFAFYVLTCALYGSMGILLFTIQHNFENSYATDTVRVNHYKAALEGTSYLVLPKILNWFTADIAYHHLHHISITIPNYRLAACHNALEDHFKDVTRVTLGDLLGTFKYQLWDPETEKVVLRP